MSRALDIFLWVCLPIGVISCAVAALGVGGVGHAFVVCCGMAAALLLGVLIGERQR